MLIVDPEKVQLIEKRNTQYQVYFRPRCENLCPFTEQKSSKTILLGSHIPITAYESLMVE